MTESKQGEGVSLDTIVFADQRNLVFVDEGHQGQKSEESVWKRIQRNIAGVGHPQAYYRGLLIEFSATFGQIAEAEHAFDRYAKSVLYDYAYDRFHADRYGKDFDVRNLQGASGWDQHGEVLATALTAYWQQLRAWRDPAIVADFQARGLTVDQPLWVLLGLSVVGAKGGDDADYRSDIIEVLCFLQRLFAEGGQALLSAALRRLASGDGEVLLPKPVWEAVRTADPTVLAGNLMRDVFGYQPGAVFVLRALKTSRGEVGRGRGGAGKRLEAPPAALAPLQTAYVYGLRADYMTRFLESLRANGIEPGREQHPTTLLPDPPLSALLHPDPVATVVTQRLAPPAGRADSLSDRAAVSRLLLRNASSLSAALGELVRYTLTAGDLSHVWKAARNCCRI